MEPRFDRRLAFRDESGLSLAVPVLSSLPESWALFVGDIGGWGRQRLALSGQALFIAERLSLDDLMLFLGGPCQSVTSSVQGARVAVYFSAIPSPNLNMMATWILDTPDVFSGPVVIARSTPLR